MFQIFDIQKALRFILLLVAVCAAGAATNLDGWGDEIWGPTDVPFVRVGSATVLGVTGLLALLGQTKFFPFFCRYLGGWRFFPDISGTYDVAIQSNWSIIKERMEGREPQVNELFVKQGTATITARLFTLHISLDMEDQYLSSKIIASAITRETGEIRPYLNYIFRATVLRPKPTDSGTHLGAARIVIPADKNISAMHGTYWTDRNWTKGLNTAGVITFTRRNT